MDLQRNEKQYLFLLVLPLLLVIAAAIVLIVFGYPNIASVVGYGGTVVVLLLVMLYVVFVDSKRRWPEASTWQRYANVITFKR